MYQIKINDKQNFDLEISKDTILINNNEFHIDSAPLPNGGFSILAGGKSYVAYVESIDQAKKTMTLTINNNLYTIEIKEPIDLLLSKMGLDMTKMQKVEPIKAPMPGLILKILVSEGQAIKKGEPVLILEAMKMENVFKAASDAVVKSIKVSEQNAVEKGQILIELA